MDWLHLPIPSHTTSESTQLVGEAFRQELGANSRLVMALSVGTAVVTAQFALGRGSLPLSVRLALLGCLVASLAAAALAFAYLFLLEKFLRNLTHELILGDAIRGAEKDGGVVPDYWRTLREEAVARKPRDEVLNLLRSGGIAAWLVAGTSLVAAGLLAML